MAMILNLFLLLSGLSFRSSHAFQSHFVFFQTPQTWYEAQSICREKCFDLATIDDMTEMEMVLEAVKDKYNDGVWIGLTKGTTPSWHWSLTAKNFYKAGESNYLKWNSANGYNCGSFQDGSLIMSYCGSSLYSVCFDGTKQGVQQYVISPPTSDWMASRDYCRTNYQDLTSLRNDAEYNMLQNVTNGRNVFVGLFRDPWVWSDQSDSSFRYWKKGKPVLTDGTKTCGAMLKQESGKWDELNCGLSYPFICDCRNKLRFIKVRISPEDSTLDPNDPSVEESILEQISQNIKSQNVTDNFQLTWRKQDDGTVFKKEKKSLKQD